MFATKDGLCRDRPFPIVRKRIHVALRLIAVSLMFFVVSVALIAVSWRLPGQADDRFSPRHQSVLVAFVVLSAGVVFFIAALIVSGTGTPR